MTRIRYKKDGFGKYEAGPFLADRQSITIKIEQRDAWDFALDIHSVDTGDLLLAFSSTSLSRVKRLAKEQCKALGVVFDGEVRNGKVKNV